MKKILLFVLLCTCSLVLQAQTTFFDVDGIRYMIEDDHAVIARQDRELTGDFMIPATVTYGNTEYSVTRLMSPYDSESGGGGAFQECKITSISLPTSITEIPNNTFSACKQLSSVTLLGPVTRIGSAAFRECEALTAIDLPDDVTEMGGQAFYESGLTQFKIPAGVTRLNDWVFLNTKITYLEIPASVTSIGISVLATDKTDEQGQPLRRTVKMFQRDCRLIEIPNPDTFGDLTTIDLLVPKGGKVVYQEYFPWMNMHSITEYGEYTGEVLVPDQRHVTIDGIRYMLKDGEAYVDIQPETLSGDITIPGEVTYVNTEYPVKTIMGCYADWLGGAFSDTQVTKVTLPNSIKYIGSEAFRGSQYLQEVVLNEGLTEIGERAFMECPELTTINIPSTITVLPRKIFRDCPKLKTLTLPEGITNLEIEALYKSGIETLTIPSTCTSLGSCSLYLPYLKTLIMKVKEPTDIVNLGGYHLETMNCAVFADYFLPNYEVVREFLSNVDVIVPLGCAESYKEQDPWFYCHSITEVGEDYYQPKTISFNIDGINYILKENTVEGQDEPVRTATIGQQNPKLLSGDIVIPEKVSYANKEYDVTDIFTSILDFYQDDGESSGAGAFQECAITSICLPATIKTIPTKTFYGCQQLKSVTLPEGITTIKAGAFENCSSLEEIYLPETITYMGGNSIFRNCTSLKKVNIPNQITSLSGELFRNSGIETFIIPQNITSIGWACFAFTHLKNIKICHKSYSDGSISFPEDIFSDISGITLIVPEGTKASLYSQVYPWKDFENIIEYSDQNDEHQYNAYRVEFEEEAEEETPAEARTRAPEENNAKVTIGFTPSGVAPELPTEIEKDGKKYTIVYKEALTTMPANDVVLKVVLKGIKSITLGKAQTTYCYDQPLNFAGVSGIRAYVASGFNPTTGTLLLMHVDEVPANTGLLLRGTAGDTYEIPIADTDFYYLNMLKGVLTGVTLPTQSDGYKNYFLKDGVFRLSDGTATVGANKAYLQLPVSTASVTSVINETPVSIPLAKAQTTYCCDQPLNFAGVSGIRAYVASGFNPTTGTLLLMHIDEVPANTGILLRGTAGVTYEIPVVDTDFYYLNMLKGVLTGVTLPTQSDGYKNYFLKDGVFRLSDGTATVGANKAYLQLPVSTANARGVIYYETDDGYTGVLDVMEDLPESDDVYYNLNGQRIDNPKKKGLYIQKGRKVVIK